MLLPHVDTVAARRKTLVELSDHVPALRRYARFLTANGNDADDLVQDCLMRAVMHIDSWQQGTNLRAWLFVILKNAFRNARRKSYFEQQRHNTFASDFMETDGVRPAQPMAAHLTDVTAALHRLSEDHREILLLVTVEGMSYEEAASLLKISVGTVKSRLSRARVMLRAALGETGDKE